MPGCRDASLLSISLPQRRKCASAVCMCETDSPGLPILLRSHWALYQYASSTHRPAGTFDSEATHKDSHIIIPKGEWSGRAYVLFSVS